MGTIALFDPWGSSLCTCPTKYSFSVYTGCPHSCLYCYISSYIPNPFQVRVKKDPIRKARRDLVKIDPAFHISIANSSDPYPPIERRLKLTREALRIFLAQGFKVQLITKSDLVTRDLDIIRRGNCSVSVTITTLDDKLASIMEPYAPPPKRRLDALRLLSSHGVPCTVRIDPIIPFLNDEGFEDLVSAVVEAGAKHVVSSTYKARMDSFKRLSEAFPNISEKLRDLYWVKGEVVGRCRYLPKRLRIDILKRLKRLVEEKGVTFATCREGLSELNSGETCDGSHLIPIRREIKRLTEF